MNLSSKAIKLAGDLGLYQLARVITAHQPRILMYHRFASTPTEGFVSRDRFREQIAYIRRFYNPMTLGDLSDHLVNGRAVPRNTIVITVDDGYRDFHDVAWPILKEQGVPATLFVTTGFVNGDLWLWPDKVTWLLDNVSPENRPFATQCLTIEEGDVGRNRKRCWKQLIDFLLAVPDEDKHRTIDALARAWALQIPGQAPDQYGPCSWEQLEAMHQQGIEIGGHTITHPTLGQVDDRQASEEIRGCRAALEDRLGIQPRSFCYPNGKPSDFSAKLMSLVEQAGFSCAVAAFSDRVGMKHQYALRRHTGSEGWFQFYKSVSGVELLGHRLRGTEVVHSG